LPGVTIIHVNHSLFTRQRAFPVLQRAKGKLLAEVMAQGAGV
jgi:hypothetical protein